MVRPPAAEIASLMQVAQEIRDTADERGYKVGVALSQDDAFARSRVPASALERSLVADAGRRGASRAGLWPDDESGGLDIVAASEEAVRRYRVKGMKVDADGEYVVICGAGSSLLVSDSGALLPEDRWILGYTVSDDHTVDQIIAAEIVGWRGSGPVRLQLGTIIELNDTLPPRGFTSSNEGLDGFDEGDSDTGGVSGL